MIELNTEQGIVRPESWDDIVSMPGFVEQLDPSTAALEDIIGRYQFREEIACGLTNCRTLHQRGYIVKTTDGRLTNIGKDCGRREFDIDFQEMSRKLERVLKEKNAREGLQEFQAKVPGLLAQIGTLTEGPPPIDWVYRNARALVGRGGVPEPVCAQVREMVRRGSRSITVVRKPTEEERAARAEMSEQSEYVEESIGTLDGAGFLRDSDRLIGGELLSHLPGVLKGLRDLDVDQLSLRQLEEWRKKVEDVEPTLREIERLVPQGHRLMRKGNIEQLRAFARSQRDQRQFKRFCRGLLQEETAPS